MMFSLSFAVVLLLTLGINGQSNDINTLGSNNVEKGYPFGQLRLAADGQNEELIAVRAVETSEGNQDQPSGAQPLPSPCVGASPSAKIPYPNEKTKYIQCRDEFHYEVSTCPNGGEFKEETNACDLTVPILDKCEREKPCLNAGQCVSLSNSTFKCTCRADWTGDRCETPMNSCVMKPCGPNAECRSLKTTDYEQDYVCVCHQKRGYGLNCQEAVANPCLTTGEQFFPYVFSPRAYIQCDGELIYFQTCGSLLYWSQEDKICDRKRPPKVNVKGLIARYAAGNNQNQQEKGTNKEEIISTTTAEQSIPQNQFGRDKEAVLAFVPARVANRQQLLDDMNNQQSFFDQTGNGTEKNSEELSHQSVESNQVPKNATLLAKQWTNHPAGSTVIQSPTFQSGQSQPWLQNTQQQWTPTFTQGSQGSPANFGQSGINQQWLNQVQGVNRPNNQQFSSPSQPWQGSQTIQQQPVFQGQNVQPVFETSTVPQNAAFLQGFQNQNIQAQHQSWQNQPTQSGQNQPAQSWQNQPAQSWQNQPTQSWQNFQTIPNQPQFIGATTTPQTVVHFPGSQNFNTQLSGGQSVGFVPQNSQSFNPQSQPWQGFQTVQQQPQFQTQNQQPTFGTAPNVNPIQSIPSTQFNANQSPQVVGVASQSSQNFVPQPQPWQKSQSNQNETQHQKRNQQWLTETSTTAQNIVRLQDLQNSNTQLLGTKSFKTIGFNPRNSQNSVQLESLLIDTQRPPSNIEQPLASQPVTNQQWLNQVPDMNTQNNQRFSSPSQSWQGSQIMQDQPQQEDENQQPIPETAQNINRFQGSQNPNIQSTHVFAFRPKQWQDPSKQSANVNPSSNTFSTQLGLNPAQPWSNDQQFQDELSDFDNSQFQPTQNFAARSALSSQNGQMIGDTFPTSTMANKGIQQGFSMPGSRNWQPNQPLEQRPTPDAVPGSWKSRS